MLAGARAWCRRWIASAIALIAVFAAGAAAAFEIPTEASYAVLMDGESGEVLFEKNAHAPMAPASMSKLMTAAMAFEALKAGRIKLDDTLRVSERAWRMQGSRMFIEVGKDIRFEDLLRGMIVQSGNDACVTIAEGLAGSEEAFAAAMTARAREIGMTDSTFRNSTGWPDPEHQMSAMDLALLARHIILTYPEYYHFYSEREFTFNDIRQFNRNRLLGSDLGVDGLKTGHTEESGYGLVSSSVKDGRRLILVVNGLSSENAREAESRRLLQIGQREFERYDLFAADGLVGTAPVFGGAADGVGLVVHEPVSRILNRAARKGLKAKLVYEAPLVAPVEKGTEVGRLIVTAPGAPETSVPVFTAARVSRIGPMGALGIGFRSLIAAAFGEDLAAAAAKDQGAPAQDN